MTKEKHYPKKLIEVALPLEAINKEAAREKSIRHGHPSTLHLWWARRPLAACRAVLFSSLVDDPTEYIDGEDKQKRERKRLFQLIVELVKWENINNDEVLDAAKLEIAKSVSRNLGLPTPVGKRAIEEFLANDAPPVLDPFAGGGSIPLEAQRLGLRAYASDLNPVAVLINKALIEIPPKFADLPPIHPPESTHEGDQTNLFEGRDWNGVKGLAEDVRYYGQWMREESNKRIGHLYPKVKITKDLLAGRTDLQERGIQAGEELTVVAWLWARAVPCPNPTCAAFMPLTRTFELSKKKGGQAWVEVTPPKEPRAGKFVHFNVRVGKGKPQKGTVNRTGATCISCGTPAPLDHVRAQAQAHNMTAQLMAIVAEGRSGRVYLSPNEVHEEIANRAQPEWKPDQELQGKARVSVPLYGMNTFGDLFTDRQLVALNTFSDLVAQAQALAEQHARQAGLADDETSLEAGGTGAQAYGEAIALYLAFGVDWASNYWSSICTWGEGFIRATFSRQAIPMVWDYCEANIFSKSTGNWLSGIEWITKAIKELPAKTPGTATMHDATKEFVFAKADVLVISTDPPYYDNIEYADLSDYFYVWLRKTLGANYSNLFNTLLVPKSEELVASPFRFNGDRTLAKRFFEDGLFLSFQNIQEKSHSLFPVSVYYAFKQSNFERAINKGDPVAITSSGWETILEALNNSGFQIVGTWPVRTERVGRSVSIGANALASSIVLICRKAITTKANITGRDFLIKLRQELRNSVRLLQSGNIAPVDLAQAAIGPGMAIYSQYDKVLEADGSKMTIRTALGLINQVLDEHLAEQEGDYDGDTRWAVTWFEQYGHKAADYGLAETLSKAKNTSIVGLDRSGILLSRAGKVRLLALDELDPNWSPLEDKKPTVWEACHYLIKALDQDGELVAAHLIVKLGAHAEAAKDLAYRLYTICERKSWAQEALGYNMLVSAWPRLKELAGKSAEAPKLI